MTYLELEKFSTEQLEHEIKRRGDSMVEKPQAKTAFVPDPIIEICEAYVNEAWTKEYINEDLPHYVFETAMECVFGADIFEKIARYINRRK